MEWTLPLTGTGIDGLSRSFDVTAITRPDDFGDIASLGLTLVKAKQLPGASSSGGLRREANQRTASPHRKDEIYFVASGTAQYRVIDEVTDIAVGDVLFCAAHVPHGFENNSDDFTVWVLFYGPEK